MESRFEKWMNNLYERKTLFRCRESYCMESNSSLNRIVWIDDKSLNFVFLCRSCGSEFSIQVLCSEIEKQYRKLKESNDVHFQDVKWFVLLIYGFRNKQINGISKVEGFLHEIVSSHLESKIGGWKVWKIFVKNVKRKFLLK